MSHQFLEQGIDTRFRVKLIKYANDTCAMTSEAYGGEAVKKSNIFEWHTHFEVKSSQVISHVRWLYHRQTRLHQI